MSYLKYLSNKTVVISAADKHEVGCPEPASVVETKHHLRTSFAFSSRVLTDGAFSRSSFTSSILISLMIRDVSNDPSIMMRDWPHYFIQSKMLGRKKDGRTKLVYSVKCGDISR